MEGEREGAEGRKRGRARWQGGQYNSDFLMDRE